MEFEKGMLLTTNGKNCYQVVEVYVKKIFTLKDLVKQDEHIFDEDDDFIGELRPIGPAAGKGRNQMERAKKLAANEKIFQNQKEKTGRGMKQSAISNQQSTISAAGELPVGIYHNPSCKTKPYRAMVNRKGFQFSESFETAAEAVRARDKFLKANGLVSGKKHCSKKQIAQNETASTNAPHQGNPFPQEFHTNKNESGLKFKRLRDSDFSGLPEKSPYPGVSYRGRPADRPWRGQFNRGKGNFFSRQYATAEEARDGIAAELKRRGLKPLSRHIWGSERAAKEKTYCGTGGKIDTDELIDPKPADDGPADEREPTVFPEQLRNRVKNSAPNPFHVEADAMFECRKCAREFPGPEKPEICTNCGSDQIGILFRVNNESSRQRIRVRDTAVESAT